jgi:hypothetical protein
MRRSEFFLAVLLMVAVGAAGFAAQQKKDKKVISSDSLIVGESSGDKSKAGKGQKKGPQVITSIGSTTDLVKKEKYDIPNTLPPPPPNKAGMLLFAEPGTKVSVTAPGFKQSFTLNEKGTLESPITLKASKATIVFSHPDYHELTQSVALKIGSTVPVPVDMVSKYGKMVLGGIPEEAKIYIDGAEQTKFDLEVVEEKGAGIDKDKKIQKASFAKILTGEHKIKIEHPDYITWEGSLDLKPGEAEENFLSAPLELAVAELSVLPKDAAKAALAGAKIYIDGVDKGAVKPDGKLVIPNIRFKRTDPYDIRIVKNGFIEETIKKALAIGPNSIEVKLRPIPNSADFSEYFRSGLSKWRTPEANEPPAEWKVENTWLVVQGAPKLGIPKDTNYRNFDAEFQVKLVNGKGIAWAVRVQGANYGDYYLFYIGGPKSQFPNELRTYVVKDGKFDLSKPFQAPTDTLVAITDTDIYTIRVEARGNKIETFIKPETGKDAKGREYQIGAFVHEDPLYYTYGDVGFCTVNGEVVMVKNLNVRAFESPEEKTASN